MCAISTRPIKDAVACGKEGINAISYNRKATCWPVRYIELNPVRAGIADHPAKYRWSSYAANALGMGNTIVTAHPEYLALGKSAVDRQSAYKGLFDDPMDVEELAILRSSMQSGTPIGNDKFKSQIEAALGRKVGLAKPGRPKRSDNLNSRQTIPGYLDSERHIRGH